MFKYIILALSIFTIDRLTKLAALQWLQAPWHISSFLSFEVTLNRGISWGMLHSANNLIFMMVSLTIIIITAMLSWFAYHQYKQGKTIGAEICIIAGSLSNIVDRFIYGGVIDFILLSYHHISWPVFNVADMAIVFGVVLLFLRYEK